jgi:hypothetical protein
VNRQDIRHRQFVPQVDAAGTVIALVNPAAASSPAETVTYDPSGTPSASGSANGLPFLYHGMEHESVDPTQYYYSGNGAYYSAQIMRSMSMTGAQGTIAIVGERLDSRLHEEARHHLATLGKSKGMRPALVLAAAQMSRWPIDDRLVDRAAAVQLVHEAMLIADDVFDSSQKRRGADTLFARFGKVRATVTGWAFATLAAELVDNDKSLRRTVREITVRGCVAEAMQERERYTARPFPLETWKAIARGDTGGIFELALAAGGIEPAGFWPGEAMAYLRHGLDDVDDILDRAGDQADVRDRVPTLLTCFTAATTRRGLMRAIPAAMAFLRPMLTPPRSLGWAERWDEPLRPFFADFATTWRALHRSAARPRPRLAAPAGRPHHKVR